MARELHITVESSSLSVMKLWFADRGGAVRSRQAYFNEHKCDQHTDALYVDADEIASEKVISCIMHNAPTVNDCAETSFCSRCSVLPRATALCLAAQDVLADASMAIALCLWDGQRSSLRCCTAIAVELSLSVHVVSV